MPNRPYWPGITRVMKQKKIDIIVKNHSLSIIAARQLIESVAQTSEPLTVTCTSRLQEKIPHFRSCYEEGLTAKVCPGGWNCEKRSGMQAH